MHYWATIVAQLFIRKYISEQSFETSLDTLTQKRFYGA